MVRFVERSEFIKKEPKLNRKDLFCDFMLTDVAHDDQPFFEIEYRTETKGKT